MSVNNPNFSVGQGERREEPPKPTEILARIPKTAHIGAASAQLPLNISHAVSTYQVTKTPTRQIAPAPGSTILGSLGKSMSLNQPAIHKKEIPKAPLSMTSTAAMTTLAGAAITNIIPVQIGGTSTTPATAALHVPNVGSIGRGPVPVQHQSFSHLPKGVVAASAHVRSGATVRQPHSIPASAIGQIRNVIPQIIRPNTPPANRSGSPAVDAHRASISLHSAATAGNTSSIQITLQASRAQADNAGKPGPSIQPGKAHVNQAINMTSQPKVVMTHSLTPVLQHPTLAAKGNRGPPIGATSLSTVTVALSTTTVTIPIISSSTTSTTIPIAKVPPQRHVVTQPLLQTHAVPTTMTVSSHADLRTESSSFPQPQPAHAHVAPATQIHTSQLHNTQSLAHSQATSGLLMYKSSQITTTANTPHSEIRESSVSHMPVFPYLFPSENPYYQQLMKCQVAAVAQANRPGLLPTHTTANIASLQGVSHGVSQASGSNVRFNNPLMVMQESLRQVVPNTGAQTASAQILANASEVIGVKASTVLSNVSAASTGMDKSAHSANISVNTVAAVASGLFTASTQGIQLPQLGHAGSNTPISTPVSNPNASPRPSILRKRTNEGISAVKKQLAMTSEVHSPRPEPRPDSTPQSNTSSPKTPASGLLKSDTHHQILGPRESPFSESQSSTDTALSSEATTPTQPHVDGKIKQELHDPHENGYTNSTPEASPRKRRKQLLQATEEIKDTPVSVFDKLVEACVKEDMETNHYDDDDDDFDDEEDETLSDDNRGEVRDEFVDEEGIRWTLEKCRPGVALLNYYNISWKPKNNHFNRYTDVKAKDERRPTVNELSNQKGVLQKASGWKLYHMAAQIEDLVELEKELNNQLTSLQTAIGPEPPLKTSLMEDESGMIHELTQGNIQRCKLISDQLNEAKAQMLKVLDHKPKISEIVNKHMSKRPIKKKERT